MEGVGSLKDALGDGGGVCPGEVMFHRLGFVRRVVFIIPVFIHFLINFSL